MGTTSDSMTPATPRPARAWYRPGPADALFVLLALLILRTAADGRLVSDPGLGWHLRGIDAIIAERGWVRTDPFSVPRAGERWYTNAWLGDLPLWLGERWAGLDGIAVVTALILALTYRLLYGFLRTDGLGPAVAALATVAAALASAPAWLARPNVVTLLFTLVTARVCERFHAGALPPRRLAWLLPLFAVWANAHGGFLAGLIILGVTGAVEVALV